MGWGVSLEIVLNETRPELHARLELDDAPVRVVVGPARDLTEPIPGPNTRDEALRDGRVRAIVKLPAGLRPAHPREQLAIWLLGSPHGQPFEEQRTFVADLSGRSLDRQLVHDLASDLAIACDAPSKHGHRTWRVLSAVRTRHLLARAESLAAPPPAALVEHRGPHRTWVDLTRLAHESELDLGVKIRPNRDPALRTVVTVNQAVQRRWVKWISGIRPTGLPLAAGSLAVWGVIDGALGQLDGVDKLSALGLPQVWLTEPGDVVYVSGSAPDAVIDDVGGALVAFPARVLKVLPNAPVTAQQLRRAVRQGGRDSGPNQWAFALTNAGQRDGLAVLSGRIDERRAALMAKLNALQDLEDGLIEACEQQRINLEID